MPTLLIRVVERAQVVDGPVYDRSSEDSGRHESPASDRGHRARCACRFERVHCRIAGGPGSTHARRVPPKRPLRSPAAERIPAQVRNLPCLRSRWRSLGGRRPSVGGDQRWPCHRRHCAKTMPISSHRDHVSDGFPTDGVLRRWQRQPMTGGHDGSHQVAGGRPPPGRRTLRPDPEGGRVRKVALDRGVADGARQRTCSSRRRSFIRR